MSESCSDGDVDVTVSQDNPAIAYTDTDWDADTPDNDRETLSTGAVVEFTKPVTDEDITAFAEASGDTNRLHLDDDFADETRFDGQIAHGALVSGWISAALARLPGTVVYLSQDLQFRAPARPGTTLTATCEVIELLGDHRYRLSTRVDDDHGTTVIDGEAVVLLDELPEQATEE